MNKWIIRILLLIGYSVPFAFLAMFGDATYGTMWFYFLLVVGFSLLCTGAIKTKQYAVVAVGNIISIVASYLCIQQFHTEEWNWYFKPFTDNMLMIIISVVIVFIQAIFVFKAYKKHRTK
ncbi:MAG: hypothetical protein R3Y09_10030 [Clostridia bacterium]